MIEGPTIQINKQNNKHIYIYKRAHCPRSVGIQLPEQSGHWDSLGSFMDHGPWTMVHGPYQFSEIELRTHLIMQNAQNSQNYGFHNKNM